MCAGLTCDKCQYTWQSRKKAGLPVVCPRCKSADWTTRPAGQDSEMARMYRSGMSIPEISEATSVPMSNVRNRLIEGGVALRSRSSGQAASCKARRSHEKRKGVKRGPFTEEWRKNISAARAKWGEENAVGVSLKPSGYIEFTRGPNKGRRVHDVIVEQRIGRRLLAGEIVHHDDEVKHNNSDENLILMTRSEHQKLHMKRRKEKEHGK